MALRKRESIIRAAEKYVSKGKLEAAIKEYRKVLAENPNDANTLNRVGDLYARIERFGEAVKLFTQIAEQYTRDGFFVKAIAIYKKIIKLDPTSLAVYERLAELYYKQGLLNEARTQYQVLADYYQKHDNAASAITIYQKMSQMEPENPSFHLKLAELYQNQRLNDKALGAYRQLADLLIVNGSVDEATQVYLKALEIADSDLQFVRQAVVGLHDGGHVGAAAQVLARATELNPAAGGLAEEIGIAGPVTPAAGPPVPGPPAPRESPEPPTEAPTEAPSDLTPPPAVTPDRGTPELEPAEDTDDTFVIPETSFTDLESLEADAYQLDAEAFEPASFEAGGDGIFTFDIDDDEVPETLVQPPADMVDQAAEVEVVQLEDEPEAATEPEIELDWSPAELELPEVELEAGEGAPGEEVEFSLELEDAELFAEVEPTAPAPTVSEPAAPEPLAPEDFALELEDLEPAAGTPDRGTPDRGTPDRGTPDREPAVGTPDGEPAGGPPAIRREEDLLAEARVFAKYGLEEKALDRLRELFDIRPDHLEALELRTRIHLQAGRHEEAIADSKEVSRVAAETGNLEPWHELRDELLKAGYSVDDDEIAREPEEKPAEDDRIAQLLEDLSLEDFELPGSGLPATSKGSARAVPEPVAAEAPATALPAAAAPPVEVAPAEVEEDQAPIAAEPPDAEPPDAEPPDAGPSEPDKLVSLVEELGLEELQDEPGAFEAPAPADVAPRSGAPAAGVPAAGVEAEWEAEAEPVAAEPRSDVPEPEPLDQTGMSWLDDVTTDEQGTVDQTAALFEEEDDFFDLAAELERELSQDDVGAAVVQPQEQSLEDIIEGFKQGVAEHLSPEDYETHFNLGIAYREMGLIDEAIGEFQLASKDERYVVDCSSLLGDCFLQKGLPELAVRWYRRGLESPSINEEATMGLLYEMGAAYLSLGDSDAAYKTFIEIYGLNSNYRDVSTKLQELQAS